VSERFETHLEPLSRWFMVSVYSLEKKYFVAIFQNVTKQKQIENKIKVAEKKFRGVFEGAGDGILAIETKSRKIIFANPTFCEMIGYSENELKKLKTEDIHPKEELLSILDKFKKATEAKHAVIIRDIPVLKNDKKIIYCDISSRIIKIGNQELALGFFRDITYHISQNNREKSK
jgi:PAS domain S-box-containing protein